MKRQHDLSSEISQCLPPSKRAKPEQKTTKKKSRKGKNKAKHEQYRKEGLELIASFKKVPGTIVLWCDGSAQPSNPGPSGAGVYIEGLPGKKENDGVWMYVSLGHGTNNKGELTAMVAALDYLDTLDQKSLEALPIEIVTDSQYSKNVVTGTWNSVENLDLIAMAREAISKREATNKVRIHWIKGHADFPGNERADEMANLGSEKSADLVKDETYLPYVKGGYTIVA